MLNIRCFCEINISNILRDYFIDAKVTVGCAKTWDKLESFLFHSKYTTQLVSLLVPDYAMKGGNLDKCRVSAYSFSP